MNGVSFDLVVRDQIEMSQDFGGKIVANEGLGFFTHRAAEAFIGSLKISFKVGNGDVNITAFSNCNESMEV